MNNNKKSNHQIDHLAWENLPCACYWMNRDHQYFWCNNEACKLFDIKFPEEIIRKTTYDIAKNSNNP